MSGSEKAGDSSAISVSFNGFVETVTYGPYSTPASIASAFGAKFSNDYLKAGLCAHASGAVITFKMKGRAPFGTLDVTGSTTSFQLSGSGFATQAAKTVDTGTVTLTVGGVVAAQTSYGDGATPSSIAESLAASVTSNSLVNITAVGNTLNIQSKLAGAGTNYSYSLQTTSWDSTDFSQPSFAYPAVSGNLDGGGNASSSTSQQTVYSYSIPSYVSGQTPTGYDAVGNIVGYTDSVMGAWSMSGGYDTLNRLTAASATSGPYSGLQIAWGIDAFGNRTSETFSGSTSVSVPTNSTTVYNVNNQISSTSLGSVVYDAAGNVTQDNQNQYLLDGDGRVCAIRNQLFGTMTGYVYGADGARISTGTISVWGSCDPTVNGYQAVKDSILGPTGGQLTEAGVDSNGNVVWAHTNVWANGSLIATYDPNGLHFYLNDWTGSRRVQTDYEGVVEQTCTSLPYGNGQSCSATPSEELYAGLERDSAAGLDNGMYRSYAFAYGRWTAPDPDIGSYHWSDPQSLNRYAYAGGSPLRRVDPSGLDWEDGCFMPAYSSTVTCSVSVGAKAAQFFGLSSTALDASPFFSVAGPVGMLATAGELFYGLGQAAGWWGGGSSFHGDIAASQAGKSVSSGPSTADGMADNPMAQALFHGAGQPYWGGANSMVTDATVGYTSLIAAGIAGPSVASSVTGLFARGVGAYYATAAGGAAAVLGRFPEYAEEAESMGANVFSMPSRLYSTLDWMGESWTANQAFLDKVLSTGQQIYLASPPLGQEGSIFQEEMFYLTGRGFGPDTWLMVAH